MSLGAEISPSVVAINTGSINDWKSGTGTIGLPLDFLLFCPNLSDLSAHYQTEQRSSFPQDHQMPAVRLELRGEAEIIVPADEFEPSAELDEAEELLREKDFRRDPPFDDHILTMIIDREGQTLVIGLRDRIEQLGTVAGVYGHTRFPPDPASPVVVEHAKPDKAVQ